MERQTRVNSRTAIALASVAGFAGGALVGFLVSRHLAEKEIEERVNAETAIIRQHYVARARRDAPTGLNEKLAAMGKQLEAGSAAARAAMGTGWTSGSMGQRNPIARVVPSDPGPSVPVQDDPDPDEGVDGDAGGLDLFEGEADSASAEIPDGWPVEDPGTDGLLLLEDEEKPAGLLAPHFITRTEFYDETEPQNQKLTITYYEGDKVLADDKDIPIRDSSNIVGTGFADLYGSGDDPDIIYVRNNRLRIDFEIVRDERGFSEVVLNYGKPQ